MADSTGTLPSDGGAREPDGFYRDGVDPHYGRMPLREAITVVAECLTDYTGRLTGPSVADRPPE